MIMRKYLMENWKYFPTIQIVIELLSQLNQGEMLELFTWLLGLAPALI